MTRSFAFVLVTLTLAACSSSALNSFTFMQGREKPIARDIMPPNFKQEILNAVTSIVEEQKGIREAYYSDPVLDPKVDTYVSCVRFNARSVAGDYKGAKEYAAYYYGGHLNQFVDAPPDLCRTASYKPFPELERLCMGGKCS